MRKIFVNVLTPKFLTQNVRGFLTPIILNQKLFKDIGIFFKFFYVENPSITDCDILFINAKYYGEMWNNHPKIIIERLSEYSRKVSKIYYCDNYDSTAPIKYEVLPFITVYFKNMILKNKALYKKSFYGGRIHTDYYHNHFNINDKSELHSKEILDESLIKKIKVSWNYGLANYGFFGSRIAAKYGLFPFKHFLKTPQIFYKPRYYKPFDVFCRISTSYNRETVAIHRKLILDKLKNYQNIGRVNPFKYYLEIIQSKIVVSPFGWGEFSIRDFESFINGNILIKPNMDHLETYPNFYIPHQTYIPFRWDLSDLVDTVNEAVSNYKNRISIAENGQNYYYDQLTSLDSKQDFCKRLKIILEEN